MVYGNQAFDWKSLIPSELHSLTRNFRPTPSGYHILPPQGKYFPLLILLQVTHIVEQHVLYERVLGTTASREAFYDAVFSGLLWFPAYVVEKARRFEAFQAICQLPKCSLFYEGIHGDNVLPGNSVSSN